MVAYVFISRLNFTAEQMLSVDKTLYSCQEESLLVNFGNELDNETKAVYF